MEAKIAAGVLFAALLACGDAHSIAWQPYSRHVPTNQIAARAIEVGEGDLPALRKAGAVPLGSLVMGGRRLDDISEVTAKEAAEFGGTHFMTGYRWSERTPDSWTVVPVNGKVGSVTYSVLRVGKAGWDGLPAELTPAEFTPEK